MNVEPGSSASIMLRDCMAQYKNAHHKKNETVWKMAGGKYKSSEIASLDFKLPNFSKSYKIQ